MPAIFGRTNELVPPIWIDHGNRIEAGDWLVLRVGRDSLDRRGDQIVAKRLAELGRHADLVRADLVIVSDITGNDLKSGWPMHGLQRLRDAKLTRYFAIETTDPLEAEWIAGHTPVHAIVIPYHAHDMAARYRVFDVAATNGVAIISQASTADEWSLQRATPQICSTIVSDAPQLGAISPLPKAAVEILWQHYQAQHPEPPKLRGVHPPETGA